jgi:hypothetical protein
MKKIILCTIVLMAFVVGAASAATLKWDPSANADEPGMAGVTYVVWEGPALDAMAEVDQTTGLTYRIPDDVPYGVYYQVHAYNVNGASARSEHVQYLNKGVPMVPDNPHIEDDETVGGVWVYKYNKPKKRQNARGINGLR